MRRIDPRREDGVAMVEFALIVPVFLLLVIGIISFGRVYFVWNDANHLANETARWASVDQNPYGPMPPTASGSLQKHVSDNGFSDSNICITFQDSTPAVGEYLTVKIEKPIRFGIKLPIIGSLDTGFTVRGTSTQRIENLEGVTFPTSYLTTTTAAGNLANMSSCP